MLKESLIDKLLVALFVGVRTPVPRCGSVVSALCQSQSDVVLSVPLYRLSCARYLTGNGALVASFFSFPLNCDFL